MTVPDADLFDLLPPIGQIDPDWFAVAPPLIAEESDIDEMIDLIEKSLKDALAVVNRD